MNYYFENCQKAVKKNVKTSYGNGKSQLNAEIFDKVVIKYP